MGWSKFLFAGPSPCPVCLTFVYRNRSCYCIAFRKNENFHWDGTTHCTPRSSETKPLSGPFAQPHMMTYTFTSRTCSPRNWLHTNTYPEKWGRNLLDIAITPSGCLSLFPTRTSIMSIMSMRIMSGKASFLCVSCGKICPATSNQVFIQIKAPDVFAATCFVH